MGNCLKTQLKEVVNNPNLPVFEAADFIGLYDNSYVAFGSNSTTVKVISGNPTYNGSPLTDGDTPSGNIMLYEDGRIRVKPKANITFLKERGLKNFDVLAELYALQTLKAYTNGDYSIMSKLHLTEFWYEGNTATNIFNGLAGSHQSLTKYRSYCAAAQDHPERYCDLNELGKCVNISQIIITKVSESQSIETFVRAQVAVGRTTNSTGTELDSFPLSLAGNSIAAGDHVIRWAPSATSGKTDVTVDGGSPVTIDNVV